MQWDTALPVRSEKKKKTFLLIEKCSIFYLITPACSTAAHLETLEIQILHTCHCHDLQY